MSRKTICAIAAFGITAALIYPLNLLWVGDPSLLSLFVATMGGALSVLSVLTTGRNDAKNDYPMPRWARILLAVLGLSVLAGLAVWDIRDNGVAEGVTRCIALGLTVLSGVASHYFCTNR